MTTAGAPEPGVIQGVIFDWGGTLTPFSSIEMEDMWRLAASHLATHTGEHEDALTQRLMQVERDFWDRTATHAEAGTLADLLAQATAAVGADVAEALLEEAGVRYLDAWTPHITHDPEARDTMQALRARGIRMGLLSNTHWPPAFHERFLERDGLAEFIDVRMYTSEMRYMKPHPEAFRSTLDALQLTDPSRVVFVGDRPFDDIFGARRMGMRAVLRAHADVPGFDVEPTATIERLPELLALVDTWNRDG